VSPTTVEDIDEENVVADLLMMVTVAGFFAVCVAYVRVCDRIIGPDPTPAPASNATDTTVAEWDDAAVTA
jgi:hypothetical protein